MTVFYDVKVSLYVHDGKMVVDSGELSTTHTIRVQFPLWFVKSIGELVDYALRKHFEQVFKTSLPISIGLHGDFGWTADSISDYTSIFRAMIYNTYDVEVHWNGEIGV